MVSMELDDCMRLLASGGVGRGALATPRGPQIVPLPYTVADDAVVVATSPYSALGTYGPGTLVAFEVEDVDADGVTAWGVLLRGRAAAVGADGSLNLYLRIPWTEVTGW